MSSNTDMLDAYLYEENNLLDQLDEMLVADEAQGDFSADDVNEIFRIMHTIKGSSAMMEFNSLSTIAHHIEDVFFYIRDKGIDTLSPEHKKELFNLMFRSEDYLRSEIQKVEEGTPLTDDIDAFAAEINGFLQKISGAAPAAGQASGGNGQAAGNASASQGAPSAGSAPASTGQNTPADGSSSAGQSVPAAADVSARQSTQTAGNAPAGQSAQPAAALGEKSQTAAAAVQANDPQAVCFFHIYLEEGLKMEHLRAFFIVGAVKESGLDFCFYPADMQTNAGRDDEIAEDGFYLSFHSEKDAAVAEGILKSQNHIRSYELLSAQELREQQPGEEPAARPSGTSGNVPVCTPAAAPQTAERASGASGNVSGAAPAAAPQRAEHPSGAPAPSKKPSAHVPVKQNLISVNLTKLDGLMDIVGEIVITESMVTSSPELNLLPRASLDRFMKSARQLRKLTGDLQDIAMSLRMVPISGVFQKMNRIVRDMKQSLHKDVRLTIVGEDTEVDKTIVDSIQDPIMHIVRNSMDHGIEATSAERTAAGKDPQGEIVLTASHSSSEVVISVSDDGYGMDPAVLLAKAKEKGILTKPESEYSRKECLGLIMLPGFSTNKEVTEYSGRGVGMDVVKKNVESVGGVVSVSSELGHGTTITMKIPLTLAIVDGMKVSVGDSIFTIPIANIRQTFMMTSDQIVRDEYGSEMVDRMGHFYPIVRLGDLYRMKSNAERIEDGSLLWVEASDRSFCLFVDDLIGEQQVVVKPLPTFLGGFGLKDAGINGCTILGDGNISLILDVAPLYLYATENN